MEGRREAWREGGRHGGKEGEGHGGERENNVCLSLTLNGRNYLHSLFKVTMK